MIQPTTSRIIRPTVSRVIGGVGGGVGPIKVVDGGTRPTQHIYDPGDRVDVHPNYAQLTSLTNWESSEGTITQATFTANGSPVAADYLVQIRDKIGIQVTDSVGNVYTYTVDAVVTDAIPVLSFPGNVNFQRGLNLPHTIDVEDYNSGGLIETVTSTHGTVAGTVITYTDILSIAYDVVVATNSGGKAIATFSVEVHKPFLTLDPANKATVMILSEGNLRCASNSSASRGVALANEGRSNGKWYWEALSLSAVSAQGVGIAVAGTNIDEYLGQNSFSWGYFPSGAYWTNAVNIGTGLPWGTNSILGFALDATGNLDIYVNGALSIPIPHGLTGQILAALSDSSASGTCNFRMNFGTDSTFGGRTTAQGNVDVMGRGDFYYTPPSGFLALTEKLNIGEMEIGSTFKVD